MIRPQPVVILCEMLREPRDGSRGSAWVRFEEHCERRLAMVCRFAGKLHAWDSTHADWFEVV